MASPSGPISETTESPLERRTCDICAHKVPLTANPLKVCARCGGVRYCSARCQRLDWPRHKVQCVKRPSAGPNKEPLRTKADLDHDAKVRAELTSDRSTTTVMALECLRSAHLAGQTDMDDLSVFLGMEEDRTPQAIKDLAAAGLRERVASGELPCHVAGLMYCARADTLFRAGVKEPITDAVRALHISNFEQRDAEWLQEYAARVKHVKHELAKDPLGGTW